MRVSDASVSASAGSSAVPEAQLAPPQAPPVAAPADPTAAVDRAVKPEVPARAQLNLNPEEKRRALTEAIAEMNRQMQAQRRDLSFQIDDVADRTVITVRHKETGEVVRQIPDETVLRVAHSIEALKGLLHDKKA